jgi:hypothetical protein
MDTHAHPAPDVNPQELSRSIHGWANFTKFAKYAILHIIALLILMAIFLL